MTRHQVFVSYSRKDRKWLDDLKNNLAPFVRQELLSIWDDSQIRAGERWLESIQDALGRARVAVMLVTPNFLASDFIARYELSSLLEAERRGGLTVIWIAVSHSAYAATALQQYQAANDPAGPLDTLPSARRNQAWVAIAETIVAALRGGGITTGDVPTDSVAQPRRIAFDDR